MEKLINTLTVINNYYKKFLYLLIPAIIIFMNFFDLVFFSMKKGQLYVMANIIVIAALLIALTRYLHYRKNDLFCLCGTIATAYISIVLFISHIVEIPLIAAVPLLGIYLAALVITFMVRFYDLHHNGR